jgi:protein-tyrosine phosphatase
MAVSYKDANEVAPRLYVGSKPPPDRYDRFDVIVLAAKEYQPPDHWFPGSEVIHAPNDDDPRRPMEMAEIEMALKTAGRVARRLRAGRRVLVTCAMGLNRSSLIAALAMHEAYGMRADEILRRIRAARGAWAMSNPNFEKLLRATIDVRALPQGGSARASHSPRSA